MRGASGMVTPVVAAAVVSVAVAQAAWKDVEITDAVDKYTVRSDCAFGVCGEKFCMLGGRSEPVLKPASIFDPTSRKWEEKDGAPEGVHHFQLAQDPEDEGNDCIWAGGAFLGPYPREQLAETVYRFCAGSGKWSEGPVIDRPRGAGGAITYDGKYYLVSGNVGGHGDFATTVPWFDEYDPKTKEWKIMPDVPNPRDHFFVEILDGKLYVAGGRDGGTAQFFANVIPEIDVYDFATGMWSTIAATFPIKSGGSMVARHGDSIVYGGGEGAEDAFDEMLFFDGTSFTAGPNMLTPRHGTGYASCNGALWTAAGVSAQGGDPKLETTHVYFKGSTVPSCDKDGIGSPDVTMASLLSSVPTAGEEDDARDDDDSAASGDSVPASADKKCFPGDATVELQSGAVVPMWSLQIGDRVRVGARKYSEVYFFSHKNASEKSEFILLETAHDGASLSLTGGHKVLANGKMVPARDVVIGDVVEVVTPGKRSKVVRSPVMNVSRRSGKGLYNPHTLDGRVVVNGVVTSCLTDALPERVANALLAPFKAAYNFAGEYPLVDAVLLKVNAAVLSLIDRSGVRDDGHASSVLSFLLSQVSSKAEL